LKETTMSTITTSQTIGPFSHEAWHWAVEATAAATLASSAPTVTITGTVYDGAGVPVNDAQVEAWLPHAAAAEAAQAVPGFRRLPTDEEGKFSLRVSLGGSAPAGEPAAYITLFARGLVKHQFTAVFLDDDGNVARSELLDQVPEERRDTLIARQTAPGQYQWDIRMQGDRETVFFDYT
jgi:protocatechuate 3,4-dioxygenase alpha subunit